MTDEITYYFAPISPWTYLGHDRLVQLANSCNKTISFKSCNILEVFERTGGMPAGKRPLPRQNYRMAELIRWRDFLKMDLTLKPKFFPVSDEMASRFILACEDAQSQSILAGAFMRATWAEERDISDLGTLQEICQENGLNGSGLLDVAKMDDIAELYAENTEAAIQADVFGSPTYIYKGENFWGQDRLDFLERALKG